jgi:quercetin dioxygenase-like cupin family protein
MKVINFYDMEPKPVSMEEARGVTIRWLISDADGAANFAMRLFEVDREGQTPLHTHDFEHEVFILEGEGVVWREGADVPIGPGAAIFIPPGEKHCFINKGEEVLRFLCMVPIVEK